jgi:hypothetical protein
MVRIYRRRLAGASLARAIASLGLLGVRADQRQFKARPREQHLVDLCLAIQLEAISGLVCWNGFPTTTATARHLSPAQAD